MKDEAELNLIIKKSVEIYPNSRACKIPDPSSQFSQTIARPFDGFGAWKGTPLYWEAKYLKTLCSFDLSRIEEHQIDNLLFYNKVLEEICPHCWVILGIKVARGDNRVYIFSDIKKIAERRKNKENYLKKELITLPYMKISKGLFEINPLLIIS